MERGARSLHSETNPRRKRSFTLPSFRKTAQLAQQALDTSAAAAEETLRIRKAAAWQWYTRAVGDVVVPTRRRITISEGAPALINVQEAMTDRKSPTAKDAPPTKPSCRAASRFKTEASAHGQPARPLAGPAPLFDEFELSGLKTQMAEFLQRLHQEQKQCQVVQIAKPQQSDRPAPAAATAPAAEKSSTQPSAEAAGSGLRRSVSVAPPAEEKSGLRRPISAVHKFFLKVMSGSFPKKTSRSAAVIYEPEIVSPGDEPEADDVQYHYHHYIHHHHHHHVHSYGSSREVGDHLTRRRRHSESSGMHPRICSRIGKDDEADASGEDTEEKIPISACLAGRRRRYSDGAFAEHNSAKKADEMKMSRNMKGPTTPAELQLPRRRNSERFTSRNNVTNEGGKVEYEGRDLWQSTDIRSRRRHSTEGFREREAASVRWSLSSAMEEEKARGGEGGVYKLGGGGAGGLQEGAYDCYKRPIARRRHSGSLDESCWQAEVALRQDLMYGNVEEGRGRPAREGGTSRHPRHACSATCPLPPSAASAIGLLSPPLNEYKKH